MSDRSLLLQKLTLGNSVAEFDRDLDRYFLETNTFRLFVENKIDIIAGDKGSGKTAIYRYVSDNYASLPALTGVTILPGVNPSGNPIFQRLAQTGSLTEGQYITVWKAYILSLIGNWILEIYEGSYSDAASKLDDVLRKTGLRAPDEAASSVFARIANWAKHLLNPKALGIEVKFDHTGLPVMTPMAQYAGEGPEPTEELDNLVSHEEALGLLNEILADLDATVWLVLDRLDEAFLGYPDIETPALRALLRTYLDLLSCSHLRLKIFVRRDLFAKILKGGFVNLTHVNDRKAEIIWDEEDLFALICRRIRGNEEFLKMAEENGLSSTTDQDLFSSLLPSHLDLGQRRQATWGWMLSRTRDGNRSIQPRNLIDLIRFAQDEQSRREQFATYHKVFPLLGPEAIRRAFTRLSKQRVEDTILAEASQEVAVCIEGLRDGKSEHNDESLANAFGVDTSHIKAFVRVLVELGFLEQVDGCYRVPMLYREGLNITQGKAFKVARSTPNTGDTSGRRAR
jgi:hypothetical protein